MLLWRYAQTFARQEDVLQPLGGAGSLVAAVELAARVAGAEIRLGAEVTRVAVEEGRVRGVVLADGTSLEAPLVLSSLGARHTLLDLLPGDALGFGTVASLRQEPIFGRCHFAFVLAGSPPFVGLSDADLSARLIIAARPESAAEAKAAALAGRIPSDPILEVTVPTAADPGLAPPDQHVVTASMPFAPVAAAESWDVERETVKRQVLATLETFAPGFRERILSMSLVVPPDSLPLSPFESASPVERLLRPYAARVTTPVAGLYLCGGAAEPATCISGRAGRIVANVALIANGDRG
jgi:phytoene dehydrogenase-like protein